jgi:hypothetical protein
MGSHSFLWLFIFFLSLGIGGGLYESLVVYPNWKNGATPQNLPQRLKDSGQALAARRFWPFISPTTALLAVINLYFAWQQTGFLRELWLAAAFAIVLKSVGTYAYFAPTMIRKFEKAESLEPAELAKSVKRWTALSPVRLCVELFGWTAAAWTLWLIAKG